MLNMIIPNCSSHSYNNYIVPTLEKNLNYYNKSCLLHDKHVPFGLCGAFKKEYWTFYHS